MRGHSTSQGRRRHNRGHKKLSIAAPEKYRLVINFPGQTRRRIFDTSDLARARSIARRNARNGAHVAFQEHQGWGRFTTTQTYTPALEPR